MSGSVPGDIDEKIKERASLLMRLYWQDRIYSIGRGLKLPFFESLSDWFSMNHYQGALEIARNMDDRKLVEILSENVKPYGVILSGFQGKYYTMDETGRLSFKSSQENVRKNVQSALAKWGEKAYGVLQAIINKNGRASYFDMVDEIGKVLGYEFLPSHILPGMSPKKLIFKTGSNKYPDWTMPSEIIPVVQEEIRSFKRPAHQHKPRSMPTGNLVRQIRQMDAIVDKITDARRNLDVVFESKFKSRLLKQNETAANDLRKQCSNEGDFNNRILSLALLIDGIENEFIVKLLKNKPEAGSINALEKLLEERVIDYEKTAIKNLRMIITLRSKRYPVHNDDPRYLDALSYFGFSGPQPDWQDLWETILDRYLDSLNLLTSSLLKVQ